MLSTRSVDERLIVKLRMDFSDVRLFVVAAQKGGVREASLALNVPASTISRAITRLEKHAGLMLLERNTRGVRLTDAGSDYLVFCEQALRRLRDGEDDLDRHRKHPRGKLTIGLPTTFAREMVMPFLKSFVEAFPDLRIRIVLHECDYPGPPEDVDFDIFFQAGAPRESSWRVKSLPSIAMCLVASPDYLERTRGPEKPEDLPLHRFVSWGPGGDVLKLNLRAKREKVAVTVPLAISITHASMQNLLTQEGLGIGYVQRWEALPAVKQGKLRFLLPEWEPDPVPFYVLYRQRVGMMPKINAFMDLVAKYLAAEQDPRKRRAKGTQVSAHNDAIT